MWYLVKSDSLPALADYLKIFWKEYPIKQSVRVSARVLKDSLPASLPVITNLINSSFASNCFAQAWKSAVVIPNLKSGDPDEP